MVSCIFSSAKDIQHWCWCLSWCFIAKLECLHCTVDSISWWPSLILLLHQQKNSISMFLECMMHNDITHPEDFFDIFAIKLAANGSDRTPSNHWMGLSWTSVQGQWSWTMGCLPWGQDSEKNQHIGCPALYAQHDILDVLIVSRIIGSAQRNIVEIVGPST